MKYVIIGSSGHHHQVEEAVKAGACNAPAAVAPGSAGEDVKALSVKLEAEYYDSWTEMLDKEKPELAVVNPWYSDNAKISMECLRRGIHVYSEKPLATEPEELYMLKEAYENSDADLGCMLNLNCCAWYRAIENSIVNGDIGEVRMIHGQKSYRMGVRGAHYQKRSLYGGTIPWISIHAVDWVLRLGGKCQWVCGTHTSACNRGNGEMETSAAVLLQLENGVIGTVDTDFLRPTGSARHDDDRLRVTGTRGMLEAIDGRVYLENEESRRELPLPEGINPFIRFINAIGTEDAKKQFSEAYEDSRICLLARESADRGEVIKV
ncbi:MAG: Gfo/Idh/MocA family oxidoreductase [Clostridia bacterium]|nr:Gfo/Idh/MocA family oxidoreductase [Clostridia bacterium]